jgi:hypothetical protein
MWPMRLLRHVKCCSVVRKGWVSVLGPRTLLKFFGGLMSSENEPSSGISLAAAIRVWIRISLLSFGGPAGQIAVMHRILVDETRWVRSGSATAGDLYRLVAA